MKCSKCNHKIVNSEHYIELEDGTTICEECFFEISLKKLNAKSKQFRED